MIIDAKGNIHDSLGRFSKKDNNGDKDKEGYPMINGASGRYRSMVMAKRDIVKTLWRTTLIELPSMTFPDTQKIFNGEIPAGVTGKDITIVNNLKRAWSFLLENTEYNIDWSYISEYNHIIGDGVVDSPGSLRHTPVRISGTSWVPDVPSFDSIHSTLERIMDDPDGERRSIRVFLAICRGQWFNDGNKRTAIMAANHMLIHTGVGIFSIPDASDSEFRNMIVHYYETDDDSRIVPWLLNNAVEHS
jgi:Fic family protein